MKKSNMFAATIGGYNQRTQPVFVHQPRQWKKQEESKPDVDEPTVHGIGQRKAGQTNLSGKPKDPTWELQKEILGH